MSLVHFDIVKILDDAHRRETTVATLPHLLTEKPADANRLLQMSVGAQI